MILSERTDGNNNPVLANNFQVSVNGLVFFADSTSQVTALTPSGAVPLSLRSWSQVSPQGIELAFSDGVSIVFKTEAEELPQEGTDALALPFYLLADTPEGSDIYAVTIPYKMSNSLTAEIQPKAKNAPPDAVEEYLVTNRTGRFMLTAPKVEQRTITLAPRGKGLVCSAIIDDKPFEFEDIVPYQLAQQQVFDQTVRMVRQGLNALFHQPLSENLSEKVIVAAVAESARNGQYNQALEAVPSAFKSTTTRRSYLSTNYFNSLAAMNRTLQMQNENIQYRLPFSVLNKNPDIFEMDTFVTYAELTPHKDLEQLFRMVARDDVPVTTVRQAAGILWVYATLSKTRHKTAALLEPALPKCAKYLESIAVLDGPHILLQPQDGQTVGIEDAILAGAALKQYGAAINNGTLEAAGRILVNSAFQSAPSLDYDTYATIYPYLVTNNSFYPHLVVLDETDEEVVWAWTCAQEVTLETDGHGTTVLKADFPVGSTHYMIVTGIKPFTSIEIYNLKFRTDPRFEAYNSSGYVYNQDTKTLLLKYHQRSATETVKLFR